MARKMSTLLSKLHERLRPMTVMEADDCSVGNFKTGEPPLISSYQDCKLLLTKDGAFLSKWTEEGELLGCLDFRDEYRDQVDAAERLDELAEEFACFGC